MVQNAVSAMQGAASELIDLTVGSVLRAFVDAYCGLALWLQGVALQVASLTRFATSNGADADSWGADFGFERLQAVSAVGDVTLSRFTTTNAATIPAAVNSGVGANGQIIWNGGTVVQTADGVNQFQVIPDTNQSAYSAALNAYVIPAMAASEHATVQAITAGASSNVTAGAITVLGSAVPGVDSVTNAAAFTSGADAESDQAFKGRFPEFLESLNEGTPTAVENAVTNLQEGATCELVENHTTSGVFQAGYFYCVVDDGSGSPDGTFLANATNAIDRVRAIDTIFNVFAPTLLDVNVAGTLTIAAGFDPTATKAKGSAAVSAFLNSFPTGTTLRYTRVFQVIYDASPGITDVTGLTLNGGTADIVATGSQLIKAGSVTFT